MTMRIHWVTLNASSTVETVGRSGEHSQFYEGVIKLACTGGIGQLETEITPFERWSKEACEMSRFDRPLNRLYARYWRRGSINPFLELGFLVFGSMIIHHFKNLMFPQSSPSPAQNTSVPPHRETYHSTSRFSSSSSLGGQPCSRPHKARHTI